MVAGTSSSRGVLVNPESEWNEDCKGAEENNSWKSNEKSNREGNVFYMLTISARRSSPGLNFHKLN